MYQLVLNHKCNVSVTEQIATYQWLYLPVGSVSDPDPNWIRIQSGQWIRIQEGKNDQQK